MFGQFQQALQALVQIAEQRKQQGQVLPPDAQVVKDTSMAETQRKAAKDASDKQLAEAKLQNEMQEHIDDNRTKIAIENSKLTHETIQNVAQAQQPAELPAPPTEGEPNGNI